MYTPGWILVPATAGLIARFFGNISPVFSQFCNVQSEAAVVSQMQVITYTTQMRIKIARFLALNALLTTPVVRDSSVPRERCDNRDS
jgi:hypothetical protein